MVATVAHQADVRTQAHHLPRARAAWVRLRQCKPVPQPEGRYGPVGSRHGRRQRWVAPVKVKAAMRTAGTTTDPRKPRSRRRVLPTASTPASASR